MQNIEIRVLITQEGLVIMTSPVGPKDMLAAARAGDPEAAIAISLFDTIHKWGADLNSGNHPMTQPNG